LLTFIYTGKALNAQSIASQLLAVAEKYEMLKFKDICGDILFNDMKIETAIQALLFADRYNATQLLDKTIEFIVINLQFICNLSEWKTLIAGNPLLIGKILESFAKKSNKYLLKQS
jgi:speckle-type POZ protein